MCSECYSVVFLCQWNWDICMLWLNLRNMKKQWIFFLNLLYVTFSIHLTNKQWHNICLYEYLYEKRKRIAGSMMCDIADRCLDSLMVVHSQTWNWCRDKIIYFWAKIAIYAETELYIFGRKLQSMQRQNNIFLGENCKCYCSTLGRPAASAQPHCNTVIIWGDYGRRMGCGMQ